MKERKRLPYLPLFIDDWMQSSGVCDLSDATRGIYVDLLCVLFKEKVRGTYSLHSKEMKWRYSRSKTQLALAKPAMAERLPYFVDFLIKPLRSTRSAILKALQELLFHEVITIVDDVLIQPRMYRDYGGKMLDEGGTDERLALPETGGYGEADDSRRDNSNKGKKKSAKKSAKKGAKKTTEKDPENPCARASRTGARTPSGSESENNNIKNSKEDNSKSIKEKGVGKTKDSARQKTQFVPQEPVEVVENAVNVQSDEDIGGPTFDEFWEAYDKKVNMIDAQNYWDVLSRDDHEAIMQYLPRYKLAQPTKRFRKNPVTFLRMRAWQDEIIQENETVPARQQKPRALKQGVQVTEVKPGQYNDDWE